MRQVVIIHGWSDTSRSFKKLAGFLVKHGYSAIPVWLGDYISMEDDVAVKDVAKRMEAVLREKIQSGDLDNTFDMIVHSTGGLVAREWLASFYSKNVDSCPVKRLVMLAPANFGSRLASMGQSMVGRLFKGWDHWFHTGKRMLWDLELSSPYQWDLARRDLFGAVGVDSCYGNQGVWPFVIVGSQPYLSGLRKMISEAGSDGTVRVAAANLNARGATIDFSSDESQPAFTEWAVRRGADWLMPLAVLKDRDHASIIDPTAGSEELGELIIKALDCNDADAYQKIQRDWEEIAEATARLGLDNPGDATSLSDGEDKSRFHQYMQVNVHVRDDHGEEVKDYFLEFTGPRDERGSNSIAYFQQHVLKHTAVNSQNSAYRCLYVDRGDLYANFYAKIQGTAEKNLCMSISAAPLGDNVQYFSSFKTGAKGSIVLHQSAEDTGGRWLRRNTTHFLEIIIPRCPADDVFKIKKYSA